MDHQGPRDNLQKESPVVQDDQQSDGSSGDDIDILLQKAAGKAGFDVSQYAVALKSEWLTIEKLRGKDVEYFKRHSGNMPVVLAEEVTETP